MLQPLSAGYLITTPFSLTSARDVIEGPTLACCRTQLHHQRNHPLAAVDEPRMGHSWTVTALLAHAAGGGALGSQAGLSYLLGL